MAFPHSPAMFCPQSVERRSEWVIVMRERNTGEDLWLEGEEGGGEGEEAVTDRSKCLGRRRAGRRTSLAASPSRLPPCPLQHFPFSNTLSGSRRQRRFGRWAVGRWTAIINPSQVGFISCTASSVPFAATTGGDREGETAEHWNLSPRVDVDGEKRILSSRRRARQSGFSSFCSPFQRRATPS